MIFYSGRCYQGKKEVMHSVTGEGYFQLRDQGKPLHEEDGWAES